MPPIRHPRLPVVQQLHLELVLAPQLRKLGLEVRGDEGRDGGRGLRGDESEGGEKRG
jgi:hypothetical protein